MTFGIQLAKWHDDETTKINANRSWLQALRRIGPQRLERIFREWDTSGSGTLSKHEFRNGVTRLLKVPPEKVNALFDQLDADG